MTGAKWTNRQGDGSAPTGLGDGTQVRKRASAAKREERKKERKLCECEADGCLTLSESLIRWELRAERDTKRQRRGKRNLNSLVFLMHSIRLPERGWNSSNMPEDQKWNCWQVQTGVCAPAVEASSLTPNTEHKQELSGPRGAVKPPVVLFFWCAGQFSGAESIYGVHILCVSSVRGKATTSRSKQPVRSTLINKCN